MVNEWWFKPAVTLALTSLVYWLITLDHRKNEFNNAAYLPTGFILFFGLIGLAGSVFFSYVLVTEQMWHSNDFVAILLLLVFCLFMLACGVDYDRRKIVWNNEELIVSKMLMRTRRYAWDDVKKIDNMPLTEAWRFWFEDGHRFAAPYRMIGIEDLLSEATSHSSIDLCDLNLQAMRDSNSSE